MIKRDLKNMKKRRAAICFLMVFIMSFTLLPSGVFAAQNDSLKAKQQLAEQSKKFDEDKEKQEEETKASETPAKETSKNCLLYTSIAVFRIDEDTKTVTVVTVQYHRRDF